MGERDQRLAGASVAGSAEDFDRGKLLRSMKVACAKRPVSASDIEASVAGNRFAAWWPSSEQSSDHPAETWSYTAHLADESPRRTS